VPRVLLIAPASNPSTLISSLEDTLQDLTRQDDFVLETREELDSKDLGDVRLVVTLPPDPGLSEFSLAMPEVQFLAIGIPEIAISPNLSVVGPNGMATDQIGFIAGFIASMVTPDWRVGVISQSDSPQGLAGLNGFLQGARYFCGACRPIYPPYLSYPQFVGLTRSEFDSVGLEAANPLLQAAVETIFIDPTIRSDSFLRELAGQGIQILGTIQPPEDLRSGWIVTIRPDPAQSIREIWQDLNEGQGGHSLPMPIRLTEVNSDLLSIGKLRLAEETLEDLQNGYIDSGVDPLTGFLK
jgi:hypothetical protein